MNAGGEGQSMELRRYLSTRHANPKQRDFFENAADRWDESPHDADKVEYITDVLRIRPSYKILDAGTGTGVMIPHYLSRLENGKVTAVDYSKNMIAAAMSKYPASENLEYLTADIYGLTWDGVFDRTVCYNCFPHFPDPVKAVEILSRTVKPEGAFCIAHSSSGEDINHIHDGGGKEIDTDHLPPMHLMEEMFRNAGLKTAFVRDDGDFYIIEGIRPRI